MIACTTTLVYLGERCRGALRWIVVSLGLFLPCFLAGARDPNIGTDIYSYAIWMYQSATELNFDAFLQDKSSMASIGWNAMTWIASRLGGSFGFYLFTIEAFCIVPIYFGLRRVAPNFEWAGILAWLLLFYAFSLNGMRQSVAMGFIFYSFTFIRDRAFLKFVACVVIGLLFHQTAAIGFALYPLARLTETKEMVIGFFGRWQGVISVVLILGAFGFALAFGDEIVMVASTLKASYSYQVQHLGSHDISVSSLYMLIACLVICIAARNDFSYTEREGAVTASAISQPSAMATIQRNAVDAKMQSCEFRMAAVFSCVGYLIWQLNYVSDTLGRFGAYGSVFTCIMLTSLMANGKRSRGHAVVLVAISVVYFVVMIMLLGKEEVYPYSSAILGI